MDTYTLLLVDDEEEVIQVITKKVKWEELGFTVIGYANNGVKALEMIEENQPDVVMTDIRMLTWTEWNFAVISRKSIRRSRCYCLPDLMSLNMPERQFI